MEFADARTLEAIDFASVRARVVGAARTERGRALAQTLSPLTDFAAVRREQAATAAVRELMASVDFSVGHAVDTQSLTETAALGRTLGAEELRAVAEAIAAAAAAYKGTRLRPSEALGAITALYAPLDDLVRALTDAIDERGIVQDRASHALGRTRRGLAQAQADARDRVTSIARSGNRALQDTVVTLRDGRFVVPVKAEFAGEFGGIVHDSSASGQTLFVEPLAAIETNNRVRSLRLEEEHEVARVLAELSRAVGMRAAQIEANVEMLARLDVLAAKAALAAASDAREPELCEEAEIAILRGRHPLLKRAVPQSLELDATTRLLVVSGPNMGGKTVVLKTVGLLVTMAYAGLQVPAGAGTRIGRFTRLFADIGDEQSIVENASTFSAHLLRLREMLDTASPRTFVLVDEVGGGTEPSAGAALAVAFLEHLLRAGAAGIVTTHATELKLFAHGTPGVANASVRFDPRTFVPTYALDVGTPGQSLTFPLARALGVDPALLDRAQELLASKERDYESAIAQLAQRNAELQDERERLAAERRHVERRETELRDERDAFARERETFAQRAEARMAQALREFVGELQRRATERASRPRVTPAQSALLDRTLAQMRGDLGIRADSATEERAGALAPGDRVRVLSLRQEGEVAEDYGESVLIAMGPLKTIANKSDVQRIGGPREPRTARAQAGETRLAAAARALAELDVRGKRFVEAEPVVERWIDEAVLVGNSPLRLVHGKGTGQLGRGLQAYLREHPAVASVRYGNADEGDGGVTIVELKAQ